MNELPRSNITQCGDLLRANVWTEHGASSKTFRTLSEAQGWIEFPSTGNRCRGKLTTSRALHNTAVAAFINKPFSEAIDAVLAVALEEAANVAIEKGTFELLAPDKGTYTVSLACEIAAAILARLPKPKVSGED